MSATDIHHDERTKAGLRPSVVFTNDAPRYAIREISLVFAYADRASVFHRAEVNLTTGQLFNYQSPKAGHCTGMICVAWAELDNGTHRLLTGRTPYFEGGMWDVTSFEPGRNMKEQPK